MSSCSISIDRCHCPSGNNKYGYMENFHDSVDNITDTILEEFGIEEKEQKEI